VHARHSITYSKRQEAVQSLLDTGVNADLGERWNAIIAASVALTATPIAFGPAHVAPAAEPVRRTPRPSHWPKSERRREERRRS